MQTMGELSYDFVAPRRIVFGWGRRAEAGRLGQQLGRRALVICGSGTLAAQGRLEEILANLRTAGVETVLLETLRSEPQVVDVDRLTATVRSYGPAVGDFVLAVGGGSAIDLAKAVAAMATERQSDTVRDYLENVGRNLQLQSQPLPVMAMPTTAGAGAEATRNAVISCYDPPFKKSLRDTRIMPQVALVDPELCVSVPASITAASGMDAITQLIESYISRRARPIPQALALQGLRLAVGAISQAVKDGHCRPAREAMSHAALLSGMALANSGLGMAHGVAAALGTVCRVPHGLACAVMLPVALRVNRHVRQAELARLAHAAFPQHRPASPEAAVEMFIQCIEQLCREVGIPERLSALGVRREHIPDIVAGSRGTSMSGNPRDLSDAELTELLEAML